MRSNYDKNSNLKQTQHSHIIEMEEKSVASRTFLNSVLPYETPSLSDHFIVGKKLGIGQFSKVYHCTQKSTGKQFACKSISKQKLSREEDYEDVRREIQIMHYLSEHPNVVQIQGAYEDSKYIHLVMELCAGGDLFDRIIERGYYCEKEAIKVITTIVGVVKDFHSLGVLHRDLRPHNILFENHDDDAKIKFVDFGSSTFFKPGQSFSEVVSCPFYSALEVLCKHHGPEADVWSSGVILHIILTGAPPFGSETESGVISQILHEELSFECDPWPSISESAKDLVKQMLEKDPKKRISAHGVLCHPWIVGDTISPEKPLDSAA